MDKRVDVGAVLSQTFSIYASQAAVLLPVAFALFLVVGVVSGLLAATLILLPIAILVSIAAQTLYQGMVVQLVDDVQDGRRDFSAGQLMGAATPVLVPLFLAGLLKGLGAGIGLLLLVVPGLYLLTIWAVVGPVVVLERTGVMDSFGRSRALVKGHGWQVFGVILIVFLIVTIVSRILGALGGDSTAARIALDVVASTITAPISALAAAVLYFALSRRVGAAGTPGQAQPAGPIPASEGQPVPPAPAGEKTQEPASPPPPQSGGPQSPAP